MKIVCESCGAKYSIADEKVAGKVFKIRCKKCSAVIVVKGDQPQEGTEETRVYDYGSDAVWHVVVNGEQQGPFAPRQVGELLAEGKIDWEAYVWREGMEGWQPAKDVQPLVAAVMAEAEGGEATRASESAPAVFGGSNDMGADPFASSDDGGLSGVIGQSVASATAAGGGADLFSEASRKAFAGGAEEEEDDAPRPGSGSFGGPKVSESQAMTGQRNENSVLFSLANLQALATGSGAAPSARPKPGTAQGEGSGLIDIRALASSTQALAEKPNVSAREKVEDLLAVGATGTTFSATSLAAPVQVEKGGPPKPLLYVMAAAIGLLGVAVAYLVVRQPSAQSNAQITPTQDGQATAPATGSAPVAPAAAPQAAEPTPSAAAAPENEAAEDEEKPTARRERDHDHHDRDHGEDRSDRSSRRHSSSESGKSGESASPPPAEEEAPKRASSGDKSIDDLLDTALGGKPKAASAPKAAAAAANENLPSTPSRDDVLSAMKSITSRVQACGGGQSGVAMAKVTVAGATGKVSAVDVSGQFAGTPAAGCIAKEVGKAKMPRFSQNSFSFSYPFKI